MALFGVSFALRLALARAFQFNGLYGQDPYAYYDFAGELLTAARTGQAPPTFFWSLGYPAVLAVGFSIFGISAAVAQGINLVLGALLTPLVYVLARQVGCRRGGALMSALVVTIGGQALQSSLVVMADIPALAWATLSAILLLIYRKRGEARWLVLSAALLALACITRWLYLALIIPWALLMLRGLRWRHAALAILAALAVFIPQFVYSATTPYPTFDHAWVQGWSPTNITARDFTNVDGEYHYERVNLLYYAQPFYDAYYLAPVFTPLLVIGVWALAKRRSPMALLLVGWALLPLCFLVGIPYQNIRYPLIVVPAVAVLVGLGADNALTRIHRWRAPYRALAAALVIVIGVGMTVDADARIVGRFLRAQQADHIAVAWAAERIPEGARVYTFELTLRLQHETKLDVRELYYETPETLYTGWVRGQTDYLLVNLWSLQNQWQGLAPETAYQWLNATRGLTDMGRIGNYHLFRVRG